MDTHAERLVHPSFGELLRHHRVAAGLTQEELADRAELSVRGLRYLEQGVRRPYPQTVRRLAEALALTPRERDAFQTAGYPPALWSGPASFQDERASGGASRTAAAVTMLYPDGPRPTLPPETMPVARHNLPVQLTRFIGRAQQLEEVQHLLEDQRLVTLTGAGGCGKTRLALEVAAHLVERYADGVWVVDLAPLSDPELVLPAIAQVLGVRADAARPLAAALVDALQGRHLLVVLDNCEHLIASCATAASALLQACRRVQILATSREPLRITGETSWRVPSLALPEPQTVFSVASLAQSEAVCLFVERATAVLPGFVLTPATAPAVVQICRQLDGMALALELAAARVRALTVEDLASRLDQCFRLLAGGSRTALPRQQTLQATVDWSFALLSEAEQALFSRLSVFAGGRSLEAAEAVCADEMITAQDVLDLLLRLVEKSLVVAEETGEGTSRYRLLETLRHYGHERLLASGGAVLVQRRHAAYYLALAERAEPELNGPEQVRWRNTLEREHDNLRAALAWYLNGDTQQAGEEAILAAESGLRLASALFWFWFLRDHWREGLAWLEQALARGAAAPAAVRARALFGAGVLATAVHDNARGQTLLTQSVALAREIGDARQQVLALSALGWALRVSAREEQAAQAAAILEESLALARTVGEPWLLAYALLHCLFRIVHSAAVEHAGERAHARELGEESLRLFQIAGDVMNTAQVQLRLGQIALHDGDYARARAAFVTNLPAIRAVGWRSEVAVALVRLADLARGHGEHGEAAALYEEGLTIYRQVGEAHLAPAIATVLSHLAAMALELDDLTGAQTRAAESLVMARDLGQEGAPEFAAALEVGTALAAVQGAAEQALRLAGAAAALRARLNRPLAATEQVTLERRLAAARRTLSAEEQATAWATGQAMTPQEAITDALDGLPRPDRSSPGVALPRGTATHAATEGP